MTEDELLQAITEAATFLGWRWTHTRRSDKAQIMGHSGFPDLVLAKSGKVLFVELKSEKGVVSPDQQAWMDAIWPSPIPIQMVESVAAIVVRPHQLDYLLDYLKAAA